MSETNQKKRQHGSDAATAIKSMLKQAEKAGFIASFSKGRHKYGYPGYDQKQFSAPFIVDFPDGSRWALFSSTSYRSDRIKGNFWDAEHLKKLVPHLTKAYMVYSDEIDQKQKAEFVAEGRKITSGAIFSPIDGIYSLSALRAKLKSIGIIGKSKGFVNNADGVAFEQRLAEALKSSANLRILQGDTEGSISQDIDLLKIVLAKLSLLPKTISKINASADSEDIGLLPTGGQPKTDVLATIEFTDSPIDKIVTISCKNSEKSFVSVAQYTADAICDAIDPGNTKLRQLLNKFQVNGTLSGLSKQESADLEQELKPLTRTFCRWVLGGIGGIGDPEKQWANYIMISKGDADQFSFWPIDEYIEHLLKQTQGGNFGTPFKFTFASKSRGKSIQLKARIAD